MRALGRTIRYWSTAERNSGIPELAGYLLANRALWLGVAALLYGASFALFRSERSGSGRRRWGRKPTLPAADAVAVPVPAPGAFRHGRRAAQRAVHRAAGAGPGRPVPGIPAQRSGHRKGLHGAQSRFGAEAGPGPWRGDFRRGTA
ncbi:hypothetical protein G6F59_016310 [Rhizopus arrhizus]|nr:hypothetical protein G6F59_016310 [Rhizopus arrhizus]